MSFRSNTGGGGRHDAAERPDSEEAIRAAVERLEASDQLKRSARLKHFVRFTVERALSGRAHTLKEATIASHVYGRGDDFDPRLDPIVRTEAHRLRAKLADYYSENRQRERVRLEYPKGSYVPAFEVATASGDGGSASSADLRVPDPRASEALLRARFALAQYQNSHAAPQLDLARSRLERALELDPEYADALVELGYLEIVQLYPPRGDEQSLLQTARWNFERALEISPEHVRAHSLMSEVCSHLGERTRAVELAQRAVKLGPDDSAASAFLSLRWLGIGFWEEAAKVAATAIELDHPTLEPFGIAVRSLLLLGEVEEARKVVALIDDRVPDSRLGGFYSSMLKLEEGDLEGAALSARESRDRATREQERAFLELFEALVAALRGHRAPGQEWLADHRDFPRTRFWGHVASLCFALRQPHQALRYLEGNPVSGHYRWLIGNRLAWPFLGDPVLQETLQDLYRQWQLDLVRHGSTLSELPPELPTPEEVIERGSFESPGDGFA